MATIGETVLQLRLRGHSCGCSLASLILVAVGSERNDGDTEGVEAALFDDAYVEDYSVLCRLQTRTNMCDE